MKILQVVPEMKMGGVETGTVDLACELVKQAHEAYVVSDGGALVSILEKNGVKHIELPVHKKSILNIWRLSKALNKIILREKIDIVHARSRVPAWISYFAVKGTSARFVTTAHGYYGAHWGSRVMGWGERVIAISEAIRTHLVQRFHVYPDRILLIPRGVNLDQFQFQPKHFNSDSPCIGIVGRLTPLKGHIDFIKAMSDVSKSFPKAKGVIIGDARQSKRFYHASLIQVRNELGLMAQIRFIPGTQNIVKNMQELDILILATTVPEAFGRVIIEAQALGIPVIATRVGGVVDIIEHGVNGWLVRPGDSKSLGKMIIEVLKKPDVSSHIIQNARRRVEEKFNLRLMVERTVGLYKETMKSPKILVIKLSALGDIILITPSLRALKQSYPQSEVTLLVKKAYSPLLKNCPYVDRLLIYEDLKFLDLIREIRRRRFDILLDLQNNKKSHAISFLSRIPKRVGYCRGVRGFTLTHKIAYRRDVGPVESQNRLLNLLDLKIENDHLELWPSLEDQKFIEVLLDKNKISKDKKLLALFPFSNARWETKRWGFDHFIELAKKLNQELGIIPVFVGGKEDIEAFDMASHGDKFRYLNFVGELNVLQLNELLKRCLALVSGDSAPLHVGAAAGIPVIALFGPTDPKRHAPPGNIHVLTHSVPCAPCYSTTCKIKTHDCLDLITVDQLFEKIKKILEYES